jgi:hypothetical protein
MLMTGFPPAVAHRLGAELGLLENAQVVFVLVFVSLAGKIWLTRVPLPPQHL